MFAECTIHYETKRCVGVRRAWGVRGHLCFCRKTNSSLNKSSWYFQWSFGSVGLSFQEKFKIDFQHHSHTGHLVHWSRTVLFILLESHLDNIPMKFDWNWPRAGGGGYSQYVLKTIGTLVNSLTFSCLVNCTHLRSTRKKKKKRKTVPCDS